MQQDLLRSGYTEHTALSGQGREGNPTPVAVLVLLVPGPTCYQLFFIQTPGGSGRKKGDKDAGIRAVLTNCSSELGGNRSKKVPISQGEPGSGAQQGVQERVTVTMVAAQAEVHRQMGGKAINSLSLSLNHLIFPNRTPWDLHSKGP